MRTLSVTVAKCLIAGLSSFGGACTPASPPRSPVIVPVTGHVAAVVDRWRPSCPTPQPIYPRTWDSTFADTVVVFASPFDRDTIASLFGVSRGADGGYWYDYQGRGGDGSEEFPGSSVDSVRVGPWLVMAGNYEMMVQPEDVDPVDSTDRVMPEHWRQSWFYAFAPLEKCAVVLAWRSPPVGSYRGPRYYEQEIDSDSLAAFISRVRWRAR